MFSVQSLWDCTDTQPDLHASAAALAELGLLS